MDWEVAQQEEERQKTARRQEKEEMAECIAIWKSSEKAWVERNNRRREWNKEVLRVWVKNCDAAKWARQPFKDAKPVPEPIEKPTPRPKAMDAVKEMEESGPESENDNDDNNDKLIEINLIILIGPLSPDPSLVAMTDTWDIKHFVPQTKSDFLKHQKSD